MKFATKSSLNLTPEGRIYLAQEQVASALEMFIKADEQLTRANGELASIIFEENEKIEASKLTKERAEEELKANNALKSRLSEFVPK